MLGNSIALMALAAFFGVEAYKNAASKLPRYVLSALSVVTFFAAVLLPQLTEAYPKVGAFIAGVFDEPASWAALAAAIYFAVRPFWIKPLVTQVDTSSIEAEVSGIATNQSQIEKSTEVQSAELAKIAAIQSTVIQNVQMLDSRLSGIPKQMDVIQSKVSAVFEFVSALAKTDFRTELTARIEWAEKLLDMAHVKFNAREYSGAVEQIRITIGKYGFSLADIDEEIAASAFAIRNDPACYVLKEGDVWRDEEAKRQWHLNKGELDGYRRLLSHASGTPSNQALSVIMSRDIS